MKTKILKLSEIKVDDKFYPRSMVDWMTVERYAQSMKSGAAFPKIVVAEHQGKYILVDGAHRIGAYKRNKEEFIEAEILEGLTAEEIFIAAVKANIGHGRQFNSQERVKIILTLRDWNMSEQAISEIVRIPTDVLKPFVAKRITRITETQEIIPLKAPIHHLSEVEVSGPINQSTFSNRDQMQILNSMISLIENGWLDMKNVHVKEKVEKITQLLNLHTIQKS